MPKTSSDIPLILVAGCVPLPGKQWRFILPNKKLELSDPDGIVEFVLPLCDGSLSLAEVKEILKKRFPVKKVGNVISLLFENNIISDTGTAHEVYNEYFKPGVAYGKHPTQEQVMAAMRAQTLPRQHGSLVPPIKPSPSFLSAIAAARASSRSFADPPLSPNQLTELFWFMYGMQSDIDTTLPKTTYTVPSGGALYGLRFDLFLLRRVGDMKPGHYLWRPLKRSFEIIRIGKTDSIAKKLLLQQFETLAFATGFFCTSAHLQKVSRKYRNNAVPLCNLEAGHSLQNAYLYAAQEDFSFLEIFGFRSDVASQIINDDKKMYTPLVCGLFGSKKRE